MNSYNREFGISEDNRRMYGKILCKNKTNAYIKSCIQYKESKKNKQTNKITLKKTKQKQNKTIEQKRKWFNWLETFSRGLFDMDCNYFLYILTIHFLRYTVKPILLYE